MNSLMGPYGALPTKYRTRPWDDGRVIPVLPPPLFAAAYSVAVQQTVVSVTVSSPVVLTTALPVTSSAVPMRVFAPTVPMSNPAGPLPAPVIQPVSLASSPSTQHLKISDSDDLWDWGMSGANAGTARKMDWAVRTDTQIPTGPAHYQPREQTD